MDGHQVEDTTPWYKSKPWDAILALVGIVAFILISNALQSETGIPFDTTYRIACAAICLFVIYKLGSNYPGQRWPRIGFWIALLANVGIFFTPLVSRPSSRGELMLFALPDAVVVLAARIVSYRVADLHQRAARQTMILGFIVALVFCAGLFAVMLLHPHVTH